MSGPEVDPASYRDPSGFVFRRDGVLYRQIQPSAADDWRAYLDSGLHDDLVRERRIVEHEEVDPALAARDGAASVIRPRELGFISYPYEWCPGQLRDAALLTLELQERAAAVGLRLKDASAFNIQLEDGRPILIDSLSFEPAPADEPWPAYRQFCEHFLAPLAVAAYRDERALLLLRDFVDGLPLDLATAFLPRRSWLRMGLAAHLHLHARAQRRYADRETDAAGGEARGRVSATGQRALLDSLRRTVEGLRWSRGASTWADYANRTSYTPEAQAAKERIVGELLAELDPGMAWDLGANTGAYSRIAADAGWRVVAFDQDVLSVERHWGTVRRDGGAGVLPLVMDLANPSPSLGWAHRERRSLADRGPADVALALALVHHLVIGRNVPLPRLAEFLATTARHVIVEFVPKEDPMTARLLAGRRDIFDDYHLDGFRTALAGRFRIRREEPLPSSGRVLFLAERLDAAP